MKLATYAAATVLALVLTRVGSFVGLPGYVFMRFEEHFPALQGEPSRIVAGLVFFAPGFVVAGLLVAAAFLRFQRHSRGIAFLAIAAGPPAFAMSQALAVVGYAAVGIHIFNSGSQVVAAGVSGFLFGIMFAVIALVAGSHRRAPAA